MNKIDAINLLIWLFSCYFNHGWVMRAKRYADNKIHFIIILGIGATIMILGGLAWYWFAFPVTINLTWIETGKYAIWDSNKMGSMMALSFGLGTWLYLGCVKIMNLLKTFSIEYTEKR